MSDQTNPYLNFDSVGRITEEIFDTKVLFESLKEALNLPTFFVKSSNGGGRQFKIIGQQDKDFVTLLVESFNSP